MALHFGKEVAVVNTQPLEIAILNFNPNRIRAISINLVKGQNTDAYPPSCQFPFPPYTDPPQQSMHCALISNSVVCINSCTIFSVSHQGRMYFCLVCVVFVSALLKKLLDTRL